MYNKQLALVLLALFIAVVSLIFDWHIVALFGFFVAGWQIGGLFTIKRKNKAR